MKISKKQLKRIIKEEKRNLLTEAAYVHDIMRKAAEALEMRDSQGLVDLGSLLSVNLSTRKVPPKITRTTTSRIESRRFIG